MQFRDGGPILWISHERTPSLASSWLVSIEGYALSFFIHNIRLYLEFVITWEDTLVNQNEMKAIIIDAGRLVGIGNGRKIGMGRFDLEGKRPPKPTPWLSQGWSLRKGARRSMSASVWAVGSSLKSLRKYQ